MPISEHHGELPFINSPPWNGTSPPSRTEGAEEPTDVEDKPSNLTISIGQDVIDLADVLVVGAVDIHSDQLGGAPGVRLCICEEAHFLLRRGAGRCRLCRCLGFWGHRRSRLIALAHGRGSNRQCRDQARSCYEFSIVTSSVLVFCEARTLRAPRCNQCPRSTLVRQRTLRSRSGTARWVGYRKAY